MEITQRTGQVVPVPAGLSGSFDYLIHFNGDHGFRQCGIIRASDVARLLGDPPTDRGVIRLFRQA